MFRDFTRYEVYEDGRIWSYDRNKWLKPEIVKGYHRVGLYNNEGEQKHYQVHRVVYEAVSGQPIPEGMQVNHIDENKTNNHFANLNLMTPKENTNWGTRTERAVKANTNHPNKSKQVAQYNLEGNLINVYPSINEIRRCYGYDLKSLWRSCNGKQKTAYGYIWKYITENPSS